MLFLSLNNFLVFSYFFVFLFFTMTVLRNIGQVCHLIFLDLGVPGSSLTVRPRLWALGKDTIDLQIVQHMISEVHAISRIYAW